MAGRPWEVLSRAAGNLTAFFPAGRFGSEDAAVARAILLLADSAKSLYVARCVRVVGPAGVARYFRAEGPHGGPLFGPNAGPWQIVETDATDSMLRLGPVHAVLVEDARAVLADPRVARAAARRPKADVPPVPPRLEEVHERPADQLPSDRLDRLLDGGAAPSLAPAVVTTDGPSATQPAPQPDVEHVAAELWDPQVVAAFRAFCAEFRLTKADAVRRLVWAGLAATNPADHGVGHGRATTDG